MKLFVLTTTSVEQPNSLVAIGLPLSPNGMAAGFYPDRIQGSNPWGGTCDAGSIPVTPTTQRGRR